MNHVLVYPEKLEEKLTDANNDINTHNKWLTIGVNTVGDMVNRIVNGLNSTYPVLSISSTRQETANTIKERIGSFGQPSDFVGYIENEKANVVALFFYIPPNADNANDFIPAKVMPPIFGIYKNIKSRTRDRHIHCMPSFIVNLCTTSRVNNASVKKQIICSETMGLYYYDLFQNRYHDVIGKKDANGNIVTKIKTLNELNDLLGGVNNNKWFEVDSKNKVLRILSNTLINSTNLTADAYRLSLYVIPAVYMAANEEYFVDTTNITNLGGEVLQTLNSFISQFK